MIYLQRCIIVLHGCRRIDLRTTQWQGWFRFPPCYGVQRPWTTNLLALVPSLRRRIAPSHVECHRLVPLMLHHLTSCAASPSQSVQI